MIIRKLPPHHRLPLRDGPELIVDEATARQLADELIARMLVGSANRRRLLALLDAEALHWRCAQCASDAFARSLRDPTRCGRCVAMKRGAA